MADRNEKREILINKSHLYEKKAKEKNINFFRQYGSLKFNALTPKDVESLTVVDHIWKVGDRYHKLAYKYYGSNDLWFLLAWFNKKPTEHHIAEGNTIHIPLPLERALYFYNR